ncbi:MAG: hypothetical protein U9N59_11850 [Campylobacterota bacterium]|nr:hypothetical protein [Campylobacterota bacterium]
MRRLLATILLTYFTATAVNASERFGDLTYEYFYGTKSTVSTNVKRVIASDKNTSPKVLKILTLDNDVAVWLTAKENLNKSF